MRVNRDRQFDPSAPPWLHCISRCVRRAFLCGHGFEHRRGWIERRLRLISRTCAVEVGAYAVMSNHLHAVLRPRPERVAALTGVEIARSWWYLRNDVDPVSGENADGVVISVNELQVESLASDPAFLKRWRGRLADLSWIMKELKEPLSRMANREDDVTGSFWEGRFKSVPLLDVKAVVACMAYVDLNPIRAQLATVPEDSDHTSVKVRIEQRDARRTARTMRANNERAAANATLRDAQLDTVAAPESTATQRGDDHSEEAYRSWLTPISQITQDYAGEPGMRLDTYLNLVEGTGRLIRGDKRGSISSELPEILARLDCDVDSWLQTVAKPHGLRGAVLGNLAALVTEASRRGGAWMQNRCALFTRERSASR